MCVCLQAFFAEQIDGVMTIINNNKKKVAKLTWIYCVLFAAIYFCIHKSMFLFRKIMW